MGMLDEIKCEFCEEPIEIDENEINSGSFICPSCGKNNDLKGSSQKKPQPIPPQKIVRCDYCDKETSLENIEILEDGFVCPGCTKKNLRQNEDWLDSLPDVPNYIDNPPGESIQNSLFLFLFAPGAWFDSFKNCSWIPVLILNSIFGVFYIISEKISITLPSYVLFSGILIGNFLTFIPAIGFNITGRWIGGKDDFHAIFYAVTFSRIPLFFAFSGMQFALLFYVYSVSLLVVFLSRAQGFSYNKGLLNILLTALSLVVPMLIVGVSFKLFFH